MSSRSAASEPASEGHGKGKQRHSLGACIPNLSCQVVDVLKAPNRKDAIEQVKKPGVLVLRVLFSLRSLLPRIELQENGDDNLVLGLCVEKTSVHGDVNVKIGTEEQGELPTHCNRVCLTLEGKLIMPDVASIAGVKISSLALSAPSDDPQSTQVDGPSDLGRISFTTGGG